jgi:hypothetical protein
MSFSLPRLTLSTAGMVPGVLAGLSDASTWRLSFSTGVSSFFDNEQLVDWSGRLWMVSGDASNDWQLGVESGTGGKPIYLRFACLLVCVNIRVSSTNIIAGTLRSKTSSIYSYQVRR